MPHLTRSIYDRDFLPTQAEIDAAVLRYIASGGRETTIAPTKAERSRRLRHAGRYYGYPECCIEQFVSDMREGHSPGQLREQGADGRIMCDVCSRLVGR